MTNALFDGKRAERFAQLLDEANGGRRHHTRSKVDSQLQELVGLGQQLRTVSVSGAAPSASFKRDLRAQLIATAEREGIGVTAVNPEPEPSRGLTWAAPKSQRTRARGAIIIGIAAGTLALSGVSVASGEAMPGDTLYPVKRQTEKAQLALAGNDLNRGQLSLEFARTRLQEAYAVRDNEASFVAALSDMDTDTQAGVKLLFTSAMDRHDTTALDSIDRFVKDQRLLVAQMLDKSTAAGRQKVTESLSLLTAIEKRSVSTRAALACGITASKVDALGPVVGSCGLVAGVGSRPGQTNQPAPESNTPAPGSSGAPAAAPSAGVSAGVSVGTEQSTSEDDGGLLGDIGRILGGLLGG